VSLRTDVTVPSRIGLLGGTFDPPHHGHLAAAETARETLGLDRVVLVVANDPWQKTAANCPPVSPVEIRLAMVRAAVVDHPDLEVDDIEIRRGGPSYTADTLAEYTQHHPKSQLFLLVGSDVAPGLDGWVRPEDVRSSATIVVMERPGHIGGRPPAGWEYEVLDGSFPDLAGRELRAVVAAGGDSSDAVPPSVATLILDHGLYGIRRRPGQMRR
tara:strand:- start:1236 stop:1877 length:642 start_codon:yes stop_codon:yes gene_type:complete